MEKYSKDVLVEVLNGVEYCDEGFLISKKTKKRLGWTDVLGYRRVKRLGHTYFEHRLVWFIFGGNIDDGMFLDHKNCNRCDNRIDNLRLVNYHQNACNKRYNLMKPKNATSTFCGVSKETWMRRDGTKGVLWKSIFNFKGTRYYLGGFEKEIDAYKAYLIKSVEVRGELNPQFVVDDYIKYIINKET